MPRHLLATSTKIHAPESTLYNESERNGKKTRRIKFNQQSLFYSRCLFFSCTCSGLHESIRRSLPRGNGDVGGRAGATSSSGRDVHRK